MVKLNKWWNEDGSKARFRVPVGTGAHPAKFSDPILKVIEGHELLPSCGFVLDPFAGVGKVHGLRSSDRTTVGVEIEKEWAAQGSGTVVGNALALPFRSNSFDAVVTSPVYGNRMSDPFRVNEASKIDGYADYLGRKVSNGSSACLYAWNRDYWDFHLAAWEESYRILRAGGVIFLNTSGFYRKKSFVDITIGHCALMNTVGFTFIEKMDVGTKRYAGARDSRGARAKSEEITVWRKDKDHGETS